MPTLSSPSIVVPNWNVLPTGFIENVFIFAESFLHDDAALLLFHCDDPKIDVEVTEWAKEYGFKVHRDWWGVNELRLASPTDPMKTVCDTYFLVFLFCLKLFFFYKLGLILLLFADSLILDKGLSLEQGPVRILHPIEPLVD